MSPYLQILDCKCSVTNSEVNLVEYEVYLNDPLFNNIFNWCSNLLCDYWGRPYIVLKIQINF